LRGWGWGGGFDAVVDVAGIGGAGKSWAAAAGRKDQFGGSGGIALEKDHVGAGAVEERGQDGRGGGWTVVAEDALVFDAAGDLEAGFAGDGAEDLVEAGVVGADVKLAVEEADLGAMRAGGWRLGGIRGGGDGCGKGVAGGQGRGGRRRQG